MSIFGSLFKALRPKKPEKQAVDVSETVVDVIGGGLLGVVVGELAEEGVKAIKKKRARKVV